MTFTRPKNVADYLENYVDEFKYEGRNLCDRMVFAFTVVKIEKIKDKWDIHGHYNDKKEAAVVFHAPKVMIASGLTSSPNMPILPNRENFQGPILHQKDFCQSSVLSSKDMSRLLGEQNQPPTWYTPPLKAENRYPGLLGNLEVVPPLF